MTAGFLVTAGGRKHETPQKLADEVRRVLGVVQAVAALDLVLARAEKAARLLIAGAPTGSVVQVQLQVLPDPVSGWSVSVLCDVVAGPPPDRRGSR